MKYTDFKMVLYCSCSLHLSYQYHYNLKAHAAYLKRRRDRPWKRKGYTNSNAVHSSIHSSFGIQQEQSDENLKQIT